MRLLLALAALLFFATPLSANPGVSIGSAIICDTSEQAHRFVTLRNDGSETVQALQVINREANSPTACGAAVVAFRPGETIKSERMQSVLVKVVKVTVLAYNNGAGWSPVPETVQYAIMVSTDIEA
jgi:P pilus assembly chaperone PapD